MPEIADQNDNASSAAIRDRGATTVRILRAACELLSEQGFQKFGINAVARRAGCDKQLIYRYYGGMDGLIEAIGTELAGWVEARMPETGGGGFLLTYGDFAERLLLLFLEALRDDPLMKKIMAWEISESSPQVRRLAEARGKALAQWMDRVRGRMQPPKGIDPTATNALLIGAVQHIVLAGEAAGRFGGLELATPKDWQKVSQALRKLVRGVYP